MRSLLFGGGRLRFLVLSLFTPFGLPVGLVRLIGLLPLILGLFQVLGWRLCHVSLFIGSGLRMIGLVWTTSGMPGVLVQRRVSFVPIVGMVGLLLVTRRCILVEVNYGYVFVVLLAGLLVVPVLVGYTESARGTRLTPHSARYSVNSSLASCPPL